MRTYTSGNITITYPDATCWLYDNLFIKVASTNLVAVGASIVVTETATGRYRKLQYNSELNTIVFSLNDCFQSLYQGGMTFNVVITPTLAGFNQPQLAFDLQVLQGRTLPGRAHGSARTMYFYDQTDLSKVGFIFPASGSLNVGGSHIAITSPGFRQLDLRPYVTTPGDYQFCFDAGGKGGGGGDVSDILSIVNVDNLTPFAGRVILEWTDTSGDIPQNKSKGGGAFRDEEFEFEDYCLNIVYNELCPDGYNFFKVRYIDTDGIMRYLGGKVVEETVESKGTPYYSLDTTTPYNKLSRRYVTEAGRTVKVAFGELRRDSYWTDILLAPHVEFLDVNNEWHECSLKTTKASVTAEESADAELEFEIYAY